MSPGTGRAVRAAAALRPSRATRTESVHVGVGVAGAVAGLAVGLIALRGTAPLAGEGSIGQVAALAVFGGAAVTAMVVLSTLTRRSLPWFGGRHWWRRALDVVGLSLVYGLLGLFLTGALFAVFQQAFQGVALDRVAGTFWVAAASAAAAYITSASAASLTGRSLATLLAVFLTVGVLASALNAPDPYWWERYFSELGEGQDLASLTFNVTLLLTGVALLMVAEFLAHDLDRWVRAAGQPHRLTVVVRSLLSVVGVLVALVALVSRTVSVFWHDVIAQLLVGVFGLTLLLVPLLLRRLPGALLWFTAAAFALLVTVTVLFVGLDYLNMTAFEMGAAAIVYVWLLLFIRTVSAAAEGTEEQVEHRDAPCSAAGPGRATMSA
ncbi:ABC transporter, permease protein (putative) [Brachybacterium faecium]|uniref:DUF998 domain-containing protein n=1 Tax=Brachybacterium faecium (strain ATCC 43885 / DSM 4810 / JCM 11609 / LMG 19847 / NBRC 14762 / NCIMB 9860 / 6-10) TaxID=446465 RepID=C7MCG6_BRAFD|nr:hypothetical protein [Brachybacterium faecium]ACU85273.1 hypothetical protein Bfae_14420 [Brachybacterium faecium DSM 4810]SLN03448.1 ABC transporter, permease protein (putative) [Brachybacterium faecium]